MGRAAGAGQLGQGSWGRAARKGQPGQDSQVRTIAAGQTGHDIWERIIKTGRTGQVVPFHARINQNSTYVSSIDRQLYCCGHVGPPTTAQSAKCQDCTATNDIRSDHWPAPAACQFRPFASCGRRQLRPFARSVRSPVPVVRQFQPFASSGRSPVPAVRQFRPFASFGRSLAPAIRPPALAARKLGPPTLLLPLTPFTWPAARSCPMTSCTTNNSKPDCDHSSDF